MKSSGDEQFWRLYRKLPKEVRNAAQKAYQLWKDNPRHPSLDFKQPKGCASKLYQARVNQDYRAMCILDAEEFTWFWIGTKQEAKKLI